MNVASLELCKELSELSGWSDTSNHWNNVIVGGHAGSVVVVDGKEYVRKSTARKWRASRYRGQDSVPAYDLGYLLRKLPKYLENHKRLNIHPIHDGGWWAGYSPVGDFDISDFAQIEQVSEDAACKLAIELFKQGILTK